MLIMKLKMPPLQGNLLSRILLLDFVESLSHYRNFISSFFSNYEIRKHFMSYGVANQIITIIRDTQYYIRLNLLTVEVFG